MQLAMQQAFGWLSGSIVVAALLVTVLTPLQAQESVQGTVVKDGEAVPGALVELHRVTRDTAGAVSRTEADHLGRFRFVLQPPDVASSFTVHFATVEHLGVRHFGPPVHGSDEAAPTEAYRVELFDTVAAENAADDLQVTRRDLVMIPERDGGWEVNELVTLRNIGTRTLVSLSGMPTWSLRIPERAGAFEVAEGDVPPDAVRRMEDQVLLTLPLLPGSRELFIRYRLPAGSAPARFPVEIRTERMSILVRQPAPAVEVQGVEAGGEMELEGDPFVQFAGGGLDPGGDVVVSWADGSAVPVSPVVAAGGVLLVLFAGAAWYAMRRPAAG